MSNDFQSGVGALRQALSACALIAGLFVIGCGGNSTPKISVSLSPSSAQTLEQGKTLAITAAVVNDSKSQGVTWAISPASGAGSLTNTTTASATYNAPSSVSSAATVTVTATSVADTTKSASITINLVPPPAISGATTPAGNVGATYSGSVTETGGMSPFTWSLASGSLPPGLSLGASTGSSVTISGTPTTQGTSTFTVKVTDAGGFSATSQSLSITVGAAATLAITTSSPLPSGNVGASYSQTLAATGGLQPYAWSLALGSSLPAGLTLSASGTISGTPTTVGTTTFTVNITDSETPTAQSASKQFSLTINQAVANACSTAPTGHESTLSGEYAFVVQGFRGSVNGTPVAIAASFGADGTGKIAGGGEMDINNSTAPQHLTINATGSLYTVGADPTGSGDFGCVQLSLSSGTTTTFHFSLGGLSSGVYSKGRIIEFDDTTGTGTRGSGILRLQTTSAFATNQLKANYAFGLDGIDLTGGHVAVGGSFSLNNSNGNITNGFADVDDAGTLSGALTAGSGSVTGISASTGRGAATFTASIYSFHMATYIINASEMFAITTDQLGATNPILSGRIIVTGAPGSFSQSSLSGNYIIHVSGSSNPAATVTLGLVTASSGALSGTLYQYNGGVAKTNTISGGTYSVDATSGRVPLTNAGSNPPVLYLATVTDGISAFIVGTDSSAIFGLAEASSGTFTTSGLAGKYFFGTEDPSDNTVQNEVGVVTVASSGAITGTQDQSGSGNPALQAGKSISGGPVSITNSNGTGNVGPNTVAITNGTKLFFIDENNSTPAVIHVVEK